MVRGRQGKSGAPPLDPVTAYAEAVLSEKIPMGSWVRLACKRHLDDLRNGHRRGLYFDPVAADHALRFFALLRHSKGEWAGKEFVLENWQKFIVGSLFGWKRKGGYRRFRVAYNEIPRKNGKSTLGAGIGNYLFIADGEAAADIYSAATKKEQAKIVFMEAVRMVQSSPSLLRRVQCYRNNMHVPATGSKFEPLGADANTLDGLNIHAAIIDELHAHKTRDVVDVIDTATGARTQPLIFEITTAGSNRQSVCYEHRTYTEQVLQGAIDDDSWFGMIFSIDEGDDWTNPKVWHKANPNLGKSLKLEDLLAKCNKAKSMPTFQNAFRRLHLNQWTEQVQRWIEMDLWNACDTMVDDNDLDGRECYGGLDLASTRDITALGLIFPNDKDGVHIKPFFWIPEDGLKERIRRDRVPYDVWVRNGLIKVTPGNVTDYNVIQSDIKALSERYKIKCIAYDRWNASQLVINLKEDGANMVGYGQGFASMSAPTKEFEKMVMGGQISHNKNPVLSWMVSNVAVKQDEAGNLKPAKDKSAAKIDGVVAAIMAIGVAMSDEEASDVINAYDEEGITIL